MASNSQEIREFDTNSVSSSVSSNKNAEIIAAAFAEPSDQILGNSNGSGIDEADKDSLSTVSSDTLEELDRSKTSSELSCADLDNDEEDDDLISVSSSEESEELESNTQPETKDSTEKRDETIRDATGKFEDEELNESDNEESDDNEESEDNEEQEETADLSQTTIKKEVKKVFHLIH